MFKTAKKWPGLVHTSGSLTSVACKAFFSTSREANTTFQGIWMIYAIFFLCSWLCTCARNKSACLLEVNRQLRCRREASGVNTVFRAFWGYSFPVPIPAFPMLWTHLALLMSPTQDLIPVLCPLLSSPLFPFAQKSSSYCIFTSINWYVT